MPGGEEGCGCVGRNWDVIEAEEAALAGTGSEAELAALTHLELADGLWHRAGAGPMALAHRLAAAVIYSFIRNDSRSWRLSPLVLDIVALGEGALPESVSALEARVAEGAGAAFLSMIERLAGAPDQAEERFAVVVGIARTAAREIAALP